MKQAFIAVRVLPAILCGLAVTVCLPGCLVTARDPVTQNTPYTARPVPYEANRSDASRDVVRENVMFLFEDRKPRYVGDVLTVQINDNLSATQSVNSTTEKKTTTTATLPAVKGVLGMGVNGLNLNVGSDNAFSGTGGAASTNSFTGSISVTVVEVLSNGNLMIAGRKKIGIDQNSKTLTLRGVIDPAFIQPGNIVSSTQVANLDMDLKGGGNMNDVQTQGWLGRVFNDWAPF